MTENLPDENNKKSNAGDGGSRILNIGNLHYHGSDLHELRKIAETNAELAAKIVEQRDKEDQRANGSYRLGIIGSLILLIVIVVSVSFVLVHIGVAATLGLMGVVLAAALLIRVVLTGEWSETSWFGRMVIALARGLGADTTKQD